MKLLDWLTGKFVDEFAKGLAQRVAKRYPPTLESGGDRKISAKGISNILESVYQTAVEFKRDKELGFVRTAKLGNTFRWELKELGYSEKFIEVATEGLIVYLTRKPVADKPTESREKK